MPVTNRFLFDTEFGSETSSVKKAPEPVECEQAIYTESDVMALKAEAFENGLREGKGQSLQGLESAFAEGVNSISTQLQQLMNDHDGKLTSLKQESASLALSIASKLAPALIELAPEAEVRKLIEDCLADLQDEPRIVIRAREDVCEKISKKIGEISNNAAFQGNLIMLPDDTKHPADCRVEWADGGAERRLEDIQNRLDEVINRFIRSTGGADKHPENTNDQPVADQI